MKLSWYILAALAALAATAITVPVMNSGLEERRGDPILEAPAIVFLAASAGVVLILSQLKPNWHQALLALAAASCGLALLVGTAHFD